MRTLHFSGTPRAIGQAFGERCRDEIAEFYGLRVANAIDQAKKHGGRDVGEEALLGVARACLEPTRAYHPEGFEELAGIAEGAGMTVEQILAMNGLTDLRDVLAWSGELEAFGGCSSFVIEGGMTASGRALCGQSWDLATDNMPFVCVVHRRPEGGPETWSLTTVGCLTLIGINDAGIAVGTTNVRTVDARPGVTYLSILHKALAAREFDAAVAAVTEAHRAGAHYYYLVDGTGQIATLECSARAAARVELADGFHVHCNHCQVPKNALIEGSTPSASSHRRQARMTELIEAGRGRLDIAAMQAALADHENGEDAICRHDYAGISSNGAVIMDPGAPAAVACHGPPCGAEWIDMLATATAR
ncbi:MAG: C45 family peptidase [Nannocystaceae bacterium]|nr:hypothetical protein [Myxococcales bacterium]